jgi:hypothetical protein
VTNAAIATDTKPSRRPDRAEISETVQDRGPAAPATAVDEAMVVVVVVVAGVAVAAHTVTPAARLRTPVEAESNNTIRKHTMTEPSPTWGQRRRVGIPPAVTGVLWLCSSLALASGAESSGASSSTLSARLQSELAGAPAKLSQRVNELVSTLSKAGVPTDPLVLKALEGLGKKVPPVRLAAVLETMATKMTWLHERLTACASQSSRGSACTARPFVVRWLEIGNEVLLGGLPPEALADFAATLCRTEQPERVLSTLAELYFHLTGRLRASASEAWSFAGHVAIRPIDEGAVKRIVVVLQEIQRRRGNLDAPLRFAAERLSRDVSWSRVRGELRDRFLRP